MADGLHGLLTRQLDISWALARYHLDGLSDEECFWRPATKGLHVRQVEGGIWRSDWPEHEGYALGPPSAAWLTWHLGFWWSMVLDHSYGDGTLTREDVTWPGTADGASAWIHGLHDAWRARLAESTDDDLQEVDRSRWPISGVPFSDIVAWANLELMKNAAEIGYVRFLFAVR